MKVAKGLRVVSNNRMTERWKEFIDIPLVKHKKHITLH